MSAVTRSFIRIAALLALILPGAGSHAQGIYPPPEALPELQLEVAGAVNAIARYNDGVSEFYVIGGAFDMVNGQPRHNLARLNLDGSLADEVADGYAAAWRTGTNAPVLALAVEGASLYVGGEFQNAGGSARSRLAKFALSDGSLDPAWAPTPNNIVRTLAPAGSGALFIAGSFNSVGGSARNAVAKLQASGALDSGWNALISGSPTHALLLDGGSLYVCGKINSASGNKRRAAVRVSAATGAFEAVWNPDFKPQGGATCYALAADATDVYAGGVFRRVGANPGNTRNNLVKLAKLDGARQSWNPGSNGLVRTLALDSAGDVYVGGDFTTLAGTARARLGKVTAAGAIAAGWSADANRGTRVIALSPSEQPLAGGAFSQLGATGVGGVARLSATTGAVDASFLASAGGPGMIHAFVVDSSGGVIVGGAFDGVRDQGGARQGRANLLRLAPDHSLDLAWTADTIGEVQSLAIDAGDNVYVGGNFTSIKGAARTRLAKLGGAAPTIDATFTQGADGAVLELLIANSSLYAGGDFLAIGGQARAFAAKLDTTTGAAGAWNPDTDGPVDALLPDTGGVFIGGGFSEVNAGTVPVLRENLALVDDTNGTAVTTFAADTDGDVLALTLDGGQLHVGGAFASLSLQATSNLGRVDPATGTPDAGWLPQIGGAVRAMDVAAGFVYAGGQFGLAAGQSHPNLARISTATGAVDHSWQPGTDQEVRQVGFLGDGTLLVGGSFGRSNALPHGGVVRFSDEGRQATQIQNLAVTPSSRAIGEPYTIDFTVANLSLPANIPTGTLSVTSVSIDESLSCAIVAYDGGTGAGSCTLTSQHAGPHTITVSFTGDPLFMDSQATTSLDVAQATTTLSLTTTSPSTFGSTVTADLSLTASSVGAAPSGPITVEVRDAGNAVVDTCQVAPATLGASSCNLANAAFAQVPGSYTLTASYGGDDNYVGDAADAVAHAVSMRATAIQIDAQASNTTTVNAPYAVTVSVSALDLSTPTGSVLISDQSGASCSVDAIAFGGGDRDCDLPSLTVGSKTLRADFTGTGTYASSDNSAQAPAIIHDVTPAATDLALGLGVANAQIGETVTATVTLAGNPAGSVLPGGNVVVTSLNTTTSGAGPGCTIAAAGPYTCPLMFGTAGDYTVTATYAEAEDTNFAAASATQPLSVTAIGTTLAISSPPTPVASVFGEGIPVTVSLTANSGVANPQGTVTVSDGLGNSCPIVFDGASTAGSCGLPSSSVGARTISASFVANAPFLDARPATLSHTVGQAGTTVTLALAPASPVFGETVTATVGLSVNLPGAGTPTGSITVSGCAAPVALPGGNCTLTAGAAGVVQSITASYAGDANFSGDSEIQGLTPGKAGTSFSSFTSTATTAEPGQSITFNWAVGAVGPGAGTPAGNVQVSVDGTGTAPQCTAPVGAGTCVIVFPTEASFTMQAAYAGDANFNGSVSLTRGIVIASAAPETADLQIMKVVSRSVVNTTNQTEQVEWTIVVGNLGPANVVGARVTDVLPASLTSDADWTCAGDGGGAQCASALGSGDIDVLVDLPADTTATLVLLTAVVNAPFPGVTNTAAIEAPNAIIDPILNNNAFSAFYQACFGNRGTSLQEHVCLFHDGFEAPPAQ